MLARARQTLVYVNLAGGPGVAGVVAVAGEHVDSVFTSTLVLARTTLTVINVHLNNMLSDSIRTKICL